MLSPLDLQNKRVVTKKRKYDKAEMDEYLELVFENYKALFDEHQELEKKVKTLSDGIQYYRSIESTMQKALVLAEKTSKETKDAAILKAEAIEKDAQTKASNIMAEAEQEYEKVKDKCIYLMQQFNQYKLQLKQVAAAQLDLITSESFDVSAPELEALHHSRTSLPDSQKKEQEENIEISPDVELSPVDEVIENKEEMSNIETPAEDESIDNATDLVDMPESAANESESDAVAVKEKPDLDKTMVIPDLKPERDKRNTPVDEEKELSILTADTIDLSSSIKQVQEEEEKNNIRKPVEVETKKVKQALVMEPVDAKTSKPLDIELKEVKVSKPEVLEPLPDEGKEAPTLDSLLQSMNMSSKKNKKKGQEEDPFEFLGSVDDF